MTAAALGPEEEAVKKAIMKEFAEASVFVIYMYKHTVHL